jgi:hypothetical protein
LLIANDKIVQLAQQCQQNVGNHQQNQKASSFAMANNFGAPQSSTPFNFPINGNDIKAKFININKYLNLVIWYSKLSLKFESFKRFFAKNSWRW